MDKYLALDRIHSEKKTWLMILNISYNRLSDFDAQSLSQKLHSLDVTRNNIKGIKNFNRKDLCSLVDIYLAKNQFSCEYLAQFVDEWDMPEKDPMRGDVSNQKHGLNCVASFKIY